MVQTRFTINRKLLVDEGSTNMPRSLTLLFVVCLLIVACPATPFAQLSFDTHDFSGVWEQTGGARGINREKLTDVPEFTPEG